MAKFFLEKSIVIHAAAARVWEVFTNPAVTRQMGGEYVSDMSCAQERWALSFMHARISTALLMIKNMLML
ncbi:MAG: hypothetical protein ACREOO_02400 [bacterium]